jgi:hypothetical protein
LREIVGEEFVDESQEFEASVPGLQVLVLDDGLILSRVALLGIALGLLWLLRRLFFRRCPTLFLLLGLLPFFGSITFRLLLIILLGSRCGGRFFSGS